MSVNEVFRLTMKVKMAKKFSKKSEQNGMDWNHRFIQIKKIIKEVVRLTMKVKMAKK